MQSIGDSFPDSAVGSVVVLGGDTLQSIAARVYGNSSLWFVLADANGLDPNQPLVAGQQLKVPNTVTSGRLDSNAHTVYDEGSIIGSTLPNLKTKPKKSGCGNVFMMIIVIVIIVVVSIYAPQLGAYLAQAWVAAGATATVAAVTTVAAYAVAGAVVAAAGSIVQQGLFIAMGYQQGFSWKAVSQAAAAGAVSGAASGASKGLETAQAVAKMGSYAKVADVAIHVTANAATQYIQNGQITSWSSLAMAGLQTYFGFDDRKQANDFNTLAKDAAQAGAPDAVKVLTDLRDTAANSAAGISRNLQFASPWLNAAESYARGNEYKAADWVGAVGQTLGMAYSDPANNSASQRFYQAAQASGRDLLIGGALGLLDKNAGNTYIEHAVGQDVGAYLGNELVGGPSGYDSAKQLMQQGRENRARNSSANYPSSNTFGEMPLNFYEPTIDAGAAPILNVASNPLIQPMNFDDLNALFAKGDKVLGDMRARQVFDNAAMETVVVEGRVGFGDVPELDANGQVINLPTLQPKSDWQFPYRGEAYNGDPFHDVLATVYNVANVAPRNLLAGAAHLVSAGVDAIPYEWRDNINHVMQPLAGEVGAMSMLDHLAGPALTTLKMSSAGFAERTVSETVGAFANSTISTSKMSSLDGAYSAKYNEIFQRDLGNSEFAYRLVKSSDLQYYELDNAISGRGNTPTYFSLDTAPSISEHMRGAQMEPGNYDTLLKIPVSELINPHVPRAYGYDKSIRPYVGREYYTSGYPEFGEGGFRQFQGTTKSYSPDWIVK